MSLTFYFAPMSTAEITDAVIRELGIPCERVNLNIAAGGTREPGFLAINPNGRVPVIVHDGTVIWESAAITLYLGEIFGVERGLYPAPGPKRGEAMKWVVWSNVTLGEAGGRLAAHAEAGTLGGAEAGSQDFLASEVRSSEEAEKARADITCCFQILDDALSSSSFLTGAHTVADTHVHSLAEWIVMMGTDLSPYPHLGGWMKRVNERPALSRRE